jgi:hypothetical protein
MIIVCFLCIIPSPEAVIKMGVRTTLTNAATKAGKSTRTTKDNYDQYLLKRKKTR